MGRCWSNYKPVPGKAAYSKGSCAPRQTSIGFKMKGVNMFSYGDSPNNTTEVKPQGELRSLTHLVPGLQEYKDHVANTPQFEEGGGIMSKLKTLGQRFVHNVSGPSNPHLTTGSGALDLVGGKGAVKLFSRGFAKLVAKQAAKKGVGKLTK